MRQKVHFLHARWSTLIDRVSLTLSLSLSLSFPGTVILIDFREAGHDLIYIPSNSDRTLHPSAI